MGKGGVYTPLHSRGVCIITPADGPIDNRRKVKKGTERMIDKHTISFFHQFDPPTTTFQARNGKWRPTPAARKAMAIWQAVLERYKPAEPLHGAIVLEIEFMFPGKQTRVRWTKPDLDNLLKGVLDICTRLGYWEDDAQIVLIKAQKRNGTLPGLFFHADAIMAGGKG